MGETIGMGDEGQYFQPPVEGETGEDGEGEAKKRYSHLIVFGFGADPRTADEAAVDPEGENDLGWHLSAGTKARVLAAGELWKMGEIDKIIMSEGGGPDKEKSGGELMREYLLAKYPEIPEDKVIAEDKAADTVENFIGTIDSIDAENEEKEQGESDADEYGLLSSRFHMARIVELAGRFGFKGDIFHAEDILRLAAMMREENTGRPTMDRFDKWEHLMSSPEGNDAYRDIDRIARDVYLYEISKMMDELKKKIEDDGVPGNEVGENEVELQLLVSLISKLTTSQSRLEVDRELESRGVDVDSLHNRIENKVEKMGKASYRDYLEQENRWLGGMKELPGYWVLQAAKVNTPRFKQMLTNPKNADAVEYLEELGFENIVEMDDGEFKEMKQTISSDAFIKEHRPDSMPPSEWGSATPQYQNK